MENKSIKEVAELIPEGFYDIFAYIIPSAVLVGSIDYLNSSINLINSLESIKSSWVFELLAILLIIGVLYCIGMVITTLSYCTVQRLIYYMIKLFKVKSIKLENRKGLDFGDLTLDMRKNNPIQVPEMIKRLARVNLSRNLFFVFLILTPYSINKSGTLFFICFTLIFLFTSYKRVIWYREDIERLEKSKDNNPEQKEQAIKL